MKKDYDYNKIENRLRSGFESAEKKAKYRGSITKDALYSNKKNNKKEKGGFFSAPAVQIAGAFLAAAIVGGGTFGAIKFLEYRAGNNPPAVTGAATDSEPYETEKNGTPEQIQEKATLISDVNGVKKYDYSPLLKNVKKAPYSADPNDFVLILTGGEVYSANTFKYQEKTKISDNYFKTYNYRPDAYSLPAIEFGGDLRLYDNVEQKEMKIINVRIKEPGTGTSNHILSSVEEAYHTVYAGKAGLYELTVDATWDESGSNKLKNGDSYTVYRIVFDIHKEESYTGFKKQWYKENSAGRYYVEVTSGGNTTSHDAARRSYKKIVSASVTSRKSFTDKCRLENVIYGKDFEIKNNVYDREMTVISVKLSDSLTDASLKKEMTLDELYEYLKYADAGKYYVTLELTWDKYPVSDIGDEGYVFEVSFTVTKSGEEYSFESVSEQQTQKDETQPEPDEFDPTGRLVIYTAADAHHPAVTLIKEYKDGKVQKRTETGARPETYICGLGEELDVEYINRERRIYAVTVNGEKTFDNFSSAFEYMENNKKYYPEAITVTAEITWDKEALTEPDADRTSYTYEFAVTFTDPYAETQTPESDPSYNKMKNYIAVIVGNEKYYPGMESKNYYIGDTVKSTRYERETVTIEWRADAEKIAVENQIYSQMYLYGVTVNGKDRYGTAEEAFLHVAEAEGKYHIEVEVLWNGGVFPDPEADRTTYTYGFDVVIKNSEF